VDILVDNVLMKRIRLGPGNYNLTDLPLNPGANNVKLVIEDDTGQHQTLEFTGFSGQELLSPGISEWSVNAGFKSYDTGTPDSGSDVAAVVRTVFPLR
jgi:outer membrane usher protein